MSNTIEQKDITQAIEQQLFQLVQKVDVKQFEETLKATINQKRESASSKEDYYDRLMLNITYYVENKAAWHKLFEQTYGQGIVPKMAQIEAELMAHQMRIRQEVAEKMDRYTEAFHKQYAALSVTEEDIVYDYAYASVEHALRIDFLTVVTAKQVTLLTQGDHVETMKMIDGYIAYYTDQLVNQMELM